MNFQFDFSANYVLETENVRLEPLQLSHIPDLLTYSINQPEIWKFSSIAAIGEENFKNYIKIA